MTQPNWGLLGGNNALANFGMGVQLGQNVVDRREAREDRNMLLDLRRQQEERLAQNDQRQQQQQETQQRRADLPMIGRLLDFAQDEPTYQRARQVAEQYGIDTSQLPPNFDPNWIGQQRQVVQMLQTPQGQEALSTAGKVAVDMGLRPGTPEFNAKVSEIWTAESTRFLATQPGGGVASVVPGQPAQFVIAPNDGSQPAGAAAVPPPPAGFVIDQGGPAPASGTFRNSFRGLPGETVTSAQRSPARNRAVGGVANSYHLSGQARDSVPPRGMSMAAYAAELQRLNPNMEVINEGDHVHMEPR